MVDAQAHASGPIARLLARVVAWVCRSRVRAGLVLAAALGLAIGCIAFGRSIRVDTDLRALLPDTAPSVIALERVEQRKGSAEELIIAIEAPTAADADAMVEGLAAEVRSWPETLEVSTMRDYKPLRDHALYLLALADLERLRDELDDAHKQAVAKGMGPGLTGGQVDVEAVSVGEEWDDPGHDELDWGPGEANTETETETETEPKRDVDELLAEQRQKLIDNGVLSEAEVALIWPQPEADGQLIWREQVGLPYAANDGAVRTIRASLTIPATDVEFARALQARVAERAAALRDGGIAAKTRAEIVAAYDVSRAVNTILADARRATWISGVLVLVVLGVGLGRARAVVLVIVPMAVAMALTLALAKLVYGELNALTVFLFAVLFGMGVDFSVHLFAQRLAAGSAEWPGSWPRIVAEQMRPLSSAMTTTVASLAVLGLAEFAAFREFGLISAFGVLASFGCALILVPATDVLLGPLRRPWAARSARVRVVSPWWGRLRAAVLLAMVGVVIVGAPKLAMEKDTRELNRSTASTAGQQRSIPYGSTGGRAKTLVLVADTPEDLDEALARLREVEAAGELLPGGVEPPDHARRPWIREVYGLRAMMPTQQDQKAPVIAAIGRRTNTFLAELPDLDVEARRHQSQLEALDRLARAQPLQVDELPSWAIEPFREADGRTDRIAHIELDIVGNQIDELVALRQRLDAVLVGLDVHAADSRLVFADLMILVERDARRLPIWALIVILLCIAADLRRVGPTLICFASLALGLGLTVAVMGLWPLKLNFFNIVVMPAVIGLGIDASIHLWHARQKSSLATTGRAALVSALTTVAGFSGLWAAHHVGLRSIGEVGVVAIVVSVGVAFVALYPLTTSRSPAP